MFECPKCNHHDVQGPTYCGGCTYGWTLRSKEHLHYRCRRCGYVAFEPCRDAKPKTPTQAIKAQ